jgi:uncharacterized SAM-binding protein YcdF (DUF218 family)
VIRGRAAKHVSSIIAKERTGQEGGVGYVGKVAEWWPRLRGALAILGAAQLFVLFTPVTRWWLAALTGPWGAPDGNVLLVLGGDQVESGPAGRATFWRTFYAAHLWKRGNFQKVLVSGSGDPPIAEQMRRMLIVAGVPPEAIAMEARSRTTRENALEAANWKWASTDRVVLVSSDLHMRRATAAFRRVGLEVTPCPAPDGIKQYLRVATRWSLALDLGVETAKLGYYWIRGWI